MRNYSLWLGLLGALLWANPAAAERLMWQLEAAHQRLVLTADAEPPLAEPPEVLLRAESGQLVLDLPEVELATIARRRLRPARSPSVELTAAQPWVCPPDAGAASG
ncbi:MAG: hypothetical protein HC838_16920 [Spirulinaceae cyanobacterium RM2_2_10]|nr:hypothetical protein [Spirulinaceae cyanobacterium RM2_2_10]